MSHREDKGKGRSYHTDLYISIPPTCLPIVYHPDYNITFMGLEKLHPFDAGKWGKVIHFLKEEQFVTDGNIVEAREATEEDLLVVHTKRYLNRLKWSLAVATITEIPPLLFLPNFLVQRKVLRPLRTQTGGTIMANIGVIWLAVQLIVPTDHPRSLCSSFFVIFVVSVPAWCCCFLCVCMLTWWIDSKCWSGSLEWTA